MTKIIFALSALVSTFAMAAPAKTYLRSSETINGTVQTRNGFWENGFQSPDSVCYVGQVKDVCRLFDAAADDQIEAYSDGEHGYFEVKKCDLGGAKGTVIYQQITDYDSSAGVQPPITLTVEPCK